MLYFYCADKENMGTIRERGIEARTTPVRLWQSLEDVRENCPSERILVIDGLALHSHALLRHHTNGQRTTTASSVPAETIQNITPYLRPKAVTAAGGYVVRRGDDEPEVVAIFRRGVWDLPKGKVESSETPEEGALREVREEIGVEELDLLDALGTTMHGYSRGGRYHVKTTFWFAMRTPETSFSPEEEEQIERVEWIPWSDAKLNIGYETLRHHMEEIEPQIWELLR